MAILFWFSTITKYVAIISIVNKQLIVLSTIKNGSACCGAIKVHSDARQV